MLLHPLRNLSLWLRPVASHGKAFEHLHETSALEGKLLNHGATREGSLLVHRKEKVLLQRRLKGLRVLLVAVGRLCGVEPPCHETSTFP